MGAGKPNGGYRSGAEAAAGTPCVAHVKSAVATAIRDMQLELQHDLHEEDMQIFGLLGKGGFGTVYHGAPPPPSSRSSPALA